MTECHTHCHGKEPQAAITINRRLKLTAAMFVGVMALSFLPPLAALNASLLDYVSLIWWAVLLGLILGGMIDYFVPDEFVIRFLGQKRKTTLFNAVIAGFLMSACSHGILAIAIELHKKGAGIPAIITFLMASPWANLPVTVLLFGLFGWQAVYFVLGAMVIAISTGFVFTLLDTKGLIEKSFSTADTGAIESTGSREFDARSAIEGIARGALSLANMVLWWLLLGVLVAALIGAYVADHLFMGYLGPDLPGMLVTLVFAAIIEVCSEGTSPLAFEIFNKTGALGNAFVFLMAGVATDYTEIGLLWTNIGRRTAIWLPIVAVPQILLAGLLFNHYLIA